MFPEKTHICIDKAHLVNDNNIKILNVKEIDILDVLHNILFAARGEMRANNISERKSVHTN